MLAVVGAMSAPAAAAEKAISVTSAVRDLPADLKTPDRHALIIGASDYADGPPTCPPALTTRNPSTRSWSIPASAYYRVTT